MSLIIMKFGGTSVGDATAMQQVAAIVRDAAQNGDQVVVVTSAMGVPSNPADRISAVKVTDSLLNSARAAADGDSDTFQRVRQELAEKHHTAINAVIVISEERQLINDTVDQLLDGFEMLCTSVRVLGEATPRALDAIGGLGERMAAPIVAGVIRANGVKAVPIDATEIIVTNDTYLLAVPLMDVTTERTRDKLLPLIQAGIVPVVTGFVGSTLKGVFTTLGPQWHRLQRQHHRGVSGRRRGAELQGRQRRAERRSAHRARSAYHPHSDISGDVGDVVFWRAGTSPDDGGTVGGQGHPATSQEHV